MALRRCKRVEREAGFEDPLEVVSSRVSHAVVESTAEVIEPFVARYVKKMMRICLLVTLVIVVVLIARAGFRYRRTNNDGRPEETSGDEVDTSTAPVSATDALEPAPEEPTADDPEADSGDS